VAGCVRTDCLAKRQNKGGLFGKEAFMINPVKILFVFLAFLFLSTPVYSDTEMDIDSVSFTETKGGRFYIYVEKLHGGYRNANNDPRSFYSLNVFLEFIDTSGAPVEVVLDDSMNFTERSDGYWDVNGNLYRAEIPKSAIISGKHPKLRSIKVAAGYRSEDGQIFKCDANYDVSPDKEFKNVIALYPITQGYILPSTVYIRIGNMNGAWMDCPD
jgi:hypothetical protein